MKSWGRRRIQSRKRSEIELPIYTFYKLHKIRILSRESGLKERSSMGSMETAQNQKGSSIFRVYPIKDEEANKKD